MKFAQTLDAIEAGRNTLRQQFALDFLWAVALGHPVDAAAALMRGFDGNDQAHIVEFTWRRDFARTPSLVATLGHVHQRTQPSNRMLLSKFINHGVSNFDSLAKYAVAFFNMSRSVLAMESSRSSSRMRI